jgi:hypothetical protein
MSISRRCIPRSTRRCTRMPGAISPHSSLPTPHPALALCCLVAVVISLSPVLFVCRDFAQLKVTNNRRATSRADISRQSSITRLAPSGPILLASVRAQPISLAPLALRSSPVAAGRAASSEKSHWDQFPSSTTQSRLLCPHRPGFVLPRRPSPSAHHFR